MACIIFKILSIWLISSVVFLIISKRSWAPKFFCKWGFHVNPNVIHFLDNNIQKGVCPRCGKSIMKFGRYKDWI